jgi:hypothetical protein
MTVESDLKAALVQLLDGIRRSEGPAITAGIDRIEALTAGARAELHPQLLHFLERRSYAKALLFLGGETEIPVGACGGRP